MAEWRSFDRFHHTRENNVLDEEEISTFDMTNVNKSNNNCDKVYSSKEYCVRCKPLAKMKNYEIMKEICLTQDCPGFLGIDAKIVSKFFDISYFHIRVLSKIFFFICEMGFPNQNSQGHLSRFYTLAFEHVFFHNQQNQNFMNFVFPYNKIAIIHFAFATYVDSELFVLL